MRLLLVRHAESQGNFESRLQGRREYPLTERGLAQAQALAARLVSLSPAALYASPLGRAMHTAEIMAERMGLAVTAEPRLQEYDFGDALSGLTWQEIRDKQPKLVATLMNDKSEFRHYPGEEGREFFKDRVCGALGEIAACHQGDDAVLVVTHAGPIVVFLMEALGRDYSRPIPFTIENASITTVEVNDKASATLPPIVVTGINDTCHLANSRATQSQET